MCVFLEKKERKLFMVGSPNVKIVKLVFVQVIQFLAISEMSSERFRVTLLATARCIIVTSDDIRRQNFQQLNLTRGSLGFGFGFGFIGLLCKMGSKMTQSRCPRMNMKKRTTSYRSSDSFSYSN